MPVLYFKSPVVWCSEDVYTSEQEYYTVIQDGVRCVFFFLPQVAEGQL